MHSQIPGHILRYNDMSIANLLSHKTIFILLYSTCNHYFNMKTIRVLNKRTYSPNNMSA
jgi:hypothetical protein